MTPEQRLCKAFELTDLGRRLFADGLRRRHSGLSETEIRRYTSNAWPNVTTGYEDTILAKLRWAKLSGGGEKQFQDALRVYEVQFATLDTQYLSRWVASLALQDYWERLLREASPF